MEIHGVRITAEDGGDAGEDLTEWLMGLEEFRPHMVIVDAPHAAAVEFGTNPAQDRTRKERPPGTPTDVERTIIEWARRKLGLSEGEARERGHRIYAGIMRYGMAPSPYLRPAFTDVVDEIFPDREDSDWYDNDPEASMETLAELIADRIVEYISEYRIDDTGALRESVSWEPMEDAGEPVNGRFDQDDPIWDGFEGVRGRQPRPDYPRR